MHRLLTLDMSDPLVPLEFSGASIRYLPLYYPLRYGYGGGQAQYRVVSNTRIEVLNVNERGPDDDEYPFMDHFPERSVYLEPFTYEQFRALLIAEEGDGFDLSRQDLRSLRGIKHEHLIQLGGHVSTLGGDIRVRCKNPKCDWENTDTAVHVFARVSAVPAADLLLFGEFSSDVEIYYGFCRGCGTIVTCNRCT